MTARPLLNVSQEAAASWDTGPLLVLAGPGSGKTATLTERVARILDRSSQESFRLLCLTFTRRAAGEMRDRLLSIVPTARDRVLLTTFHSFAGDILRQHGSHFGFTPAFEVIAEQDRAILMKPILASGQYPRFVSAEKAVFALDILLRNGIGETEISGQVEDQELASQLTSLYRAYQSALVESNSVDYSSMLHLCERLLRSRPRVASQLAAVYKYICVDEFQDTNLAQYRLLRALAPKRDSNLFIVADDDQVIYQWNGASPSRIQELAADYDITTVQLPENYRCPPEVVELANTLISFNRDRAPGKQILKSMKTRSKIDAISVHCFADDQTEANGLAQLIATRIRVGVKPSDLAVLARNTKHLERIQKALTGASVEAHLQRRRTDFESAPMRFLVAALKLLVVRSDEDLAASAAKALSDCVKADLRAEPIAAAAAQQNGDYLAGLKLVAQRTSEFPATLAEVLQRLSEDTYGEFVRDVLKYFDIATEGMEEEGGDAFVDYELERKIWDAFVGELGGQSEAYSLPLPQLLQEFALANKTPDAPESAVRCLTIHGAKGLEFGHVYLSGLAEDQLPSFQSKKAGDESREMQEERRNCFVAITRTLETLTLTYAKRYSGWAKEPSRFLVEMGLLQNG